MILSAGWGASGSAAESESRARTAEAVATVLRAAFNVLNAGGDEPLLWAFPTLAFAGDGDRLRLLPLIRRASFKVVSGL